MPVPSSIVFAPTSTPKTGSTTAMAVASSTNSAPTGIPTGMPQVIQAPGGEPSPPTNFTLVQVGFTYSLNYQFVAGNGSAISQIFTYLPQGIAYGLGVSQDQVKMNALIPYDTTSTLGYMTTLAQAYIPGDLVNQMQLDLHQPNSNMYENPSPPVNTLMSFINPTLPMYPGSSLDNGGTYTANPGATSSSPATDGAPIGGDSGSSQPVKGTSVGIGIGAVAGAAIYAAAMVYVARRYRRNRQNHQRASSVPGSPGPETGERASGGGMGGMGGFFMSGANGRGSGTTGAVGSRNSGGSSNSRSVREQGISAPVMSENSLGWN